MSVENLLKKLEKKSWFDKVLDQLVFKGELTIELKPSDLPAILLKLRDDKDTKFRMLVSIHGADYPARDKRFEVVYNLLSVEENARVRIKLQVNEQDFVPSIIDIYPNANWYEREVWDMYGVKFSNHPDLRRILTDYNFEGHPLRKDFPLTGNVEVRYDIETKRVTYDDVRLTQEFRNFDAISPWAGTDYVLPGDEKATKDKA